MAAVREGERTSQSMSTQTKIAVGFVVGVVAGLGATLAIAGLIERRRGS